ncbi:MAG TPA: ABC transporter ATP-binding protein, partial [Pseudonocardiaceae bacterium]|nr:ABC transporter ATP-binding protein [Pseudonocardiaceae bacterium]
MKRLLGLLRPVRTRVAAMALLGLASIVLSVIGPAVLGRATDLILAGDRTGPARVLLVALAVYTVSGGCYAAQGRFTTAVTQRIAFRLRDRLAAKLARLPLDHVDARPRGELLSRATNDVDNIVLTLQQTIASVTNSSLLVVGTLTMMLWISPLLAGVTVVLVPVSAWLTKALAAKAKRDFAGQWRATGALQAHVAERYSAHVLATLYGRTDLDTFDRHNDDLYRAGLRAQVVSGLIQPAMALLGNVNFVVVAVIGGLRAASGALSVGDVQALIQYSRQFTGPLAQLTNVAGILQSGIASAERVFEILDAPEETPEPPGEAFSAGEVCFEDVSFGYRPGRPVIDNLSLHVPPGRTVAVVGPTGAGKTTLVNLLMRFYEPDSGRITIDGVDIATMSRDRLRSRIGMVLQDTWLFTGTVADNIAYGDTSASRDRIVAAARAAHADRFIRALPDGYDTVIGEHGTELSAGERQLITIARAFLADPVI